MKTNGPKDDDDNYSNQLNPNNDAYWQSRGYDERPNDWDDDDDDDEYSRNEYDDDEDFTDGFPASDWEW